MAGRAIVAVVGIGVEDLGAGAGGAVTGIAIASLMLLGALGREGTMLNEAGPR
jgi:hypothetical protein